MPCSPGARTPSSIGTSSRRASRCRTASSRVSTAGCAMNCSTRPCSSISTTPAPSSPTGRRLQSPAAPLVAEIPHPRGLCRPPHRNERSAAQPRPAPPIVRCSTHAAWRTKLRDSNRRWMKMQWQVTGDYRLCSSRMAWFRKLYLERSTPTVEVTDPLVAQLHADLRGLPPLFSIDNAAAFVRSQRRAPSRHD